LNVHSKIFTLFRGLLYLLLHSASLGCAKKPHKNGRYLELEMIALKKDVDENGEKLLFQLFFLKDDEDQNVEVKEVEEIDFRGVKERLEQGESVFITYKRKQKLNSNLIVSEEETEPWYFIHI
jgi:hypothetical protein